MSKRLASLTRIEHLQSRIVALADLQIAQAQRRCCELAEDQERLRTFVGDGEALGAPLAKAALRASVTNERRLAQAAADRVAATERRDAAKRRQKTVSAMAAAEAVDARRAAADRELAEILDAWLARGGA